MKKSILMVGPLQERARATSVAVKEVSRVPHVRERHVTNVQSAEVRER